MQQEFPNLLSMTMKIFLQSDCKKAGISKGSLFKYFSTKKDFNYYVLDKITAKLISSLEEKVNTLSQNLFQRIIEYSVLEF